MISTIGQCPIWLGLVAGQGFRVSESPTEVPVHPLTAVLAHYAAAQPAVMLSTHRVETTRAGGAEFNQVLVNPCNDPSFMLSPLGRLPWHVPQQLVQPDHQSVGLCCIPVNPGTSSLLELLEVTPARSFFIMERKF